MFKKLYLIYIVLTVFSASFAENGENSNAFNKYMSPEGGINPLSGTVALTKSLASISAGDVSVSFDLSYSGNIFKEMNTRNDQTTVGLVGLGWTLGRAKVVSDNRGTSFIGDDQFYLVLSSGGRFKIFKENPSNPNDKWWVEGNPFMKVEQVVDSADVTGKGDYITFVKGWRITDTKGVVHEYGDINEDRTKILKNPQRNATEYDLFWPLMNDGVTLGYGLIGKAIGGHPWLYPTVWNVSRETDVEGNYLEYAYDQITEGLSGNFERMGHWDSEGREYTKESYLKNVVSSIGDSLQFEYRNKGEGAFFGEYLDYEGKKNEFLGDTDVDMSIEKVNRKYLAKIVISGRNGRVGSVELCYSALKQYRMDGSKKEGFVKRLLSAVRFFNKSGVESDYEYYGYYDGSEKAVGTPSNVAYPLGALFSVKGKECGWVEYTYVKETLGQGHMETLNADKIFGKGYLEDGTPYLVGKITNKIVVVFHRINGSWKMVRTFDVNNVSDVELGDQGWFLIKDNLGDDKDRVLVYQWNGKQWNNVYEEVLDNNTELWSTSKKAMNVFAGPDYVVYVKTKKDGIMSDPKTEIKVVWSKWGEKFGIDNISDATVNESGVRVMAQKNHILVQVTTTDFSNAVKFFVYTFDSKGTMKGSYGKKNQDNGSMYFLGDGYFVGVEEPSAYFAADSWFSAWHWTGDSWIREYKNVFDNDGLYTAMDLQAHGQDYYTVRHHSKRYLTNYYWDTEKWSTKAGAKQRHFQVQDYPWFSAAWKWAGFSGRDFFVAGQSRLKCKWWGCDVKKYVYLHLYYMKDAENKKWTYDYIGSKGEKMNQKEIITGTDWFIEKNLVKIAWIWDGEKWIEESLYGKVSNIQNAYSLGDDAFAVPAGNKTNIYYKVGNSFSGFYDSYHVRTKTIYEPVVDKTIEYTYSFTKDTTKIAYDEANNTPLFKEMSVTLPFGQGEKHSALCSGIYAKNGKVEYNVGLGLTCVETQRGRSNSKDDGKNALLFRKETSYERYRDSVWPARVYQDRIIKDVSFNGLTKETTTYGYSSKNGQVVSTIKKNGTKTTEEITKYVADLNSPLSDYDNKLGKNNRIDVVAGGYSCIGTCESGRVISAFANGWDTVNNIFRSVSTWKMAPQKRMSQTDVENGISYIVKNGSASSYANWKRSSYNSVYKGGDVIETEEGPKKVKMASFKNSLTRRVYGTAAGCGIDEGLMLSGEYCGPINDVTWSGCVLNEPMDSIKYYAINGNAGNQYGRFSTKLLKLSPSGVLSATIQKPQRKEYRISAWVQTKDNDSVKVRVSLGSNVLEKNVKTNQGWQMVEFMTSKLQSTASILFTMTTTAPSGIRIQDVRVLPYDATSSALFWNDMWDKVITTVNDRGVGSYVVYDNMGREVESYSETAEGNVYLAIRKTFVDGSCIIAASGDDKLKFVKVNGKVYSNPSSKKSFALDAIDIDVELGLDTASKPEVRYALVKGGESDWKNKKIQEWTPAACGGLCPISFKLSEHPEWMLFVDVAPFDTVHKPYGDYAFRFGTKTKDWVVYGQIGGFADGEIPQFMNPYDSVNVVYRNDDNDSIYRSNFSQGNWMNTSQAVVAARSVAYSFAHGKNNGNNIYSLSLIPVVNDADDSTTMLAYPRTYGSDDGASFIYRNLNDDSFSVDDMKVAISGNTSALLYRADVRAKVVPVTLRDSTDTTRTYQKTMPRRVADDMLYSKIWNIQSSQWENLGAVPVFDKDTLSASISGRDTVLKVVHGNLVSYLDGVVCDYSNKTFDMISGPGGKLYVAYIGNPKNFEVNAKNTEDDGTENNVKIAPAYIVVKRLYDASETSMGRSVWAGPSKISGQPRYEGDIVSWDGTNLHAIDEPQAVKLAYDGRSLFMAVVYKTHPDERFNDDEEVGDQNAVANADIDYGELALTVFKATEQQNVNADGVTYSSYLRWVPVKDDSIAVAKKGNTLSDEQSRVLYMQPDDLFDLKVRGDTAYLLFGNRANGNRISVIKHDGNRWLSIGNPAFAYPVQSEKSVDLAVKSNGNPYVVFKQGLEAGYVTRKGKLVTMRYNANDKVDLSISALDLGADSLNESCAFRQYILNYALNVGYESILSVKPTLRTPSDVARIEIYVNDNILQSRLPNSTAVSNIVLGERLNRIELRVVGKDGSELSYYLNTYRKPRPDPGLWGNGNSLVVNGYMVGDTAKLDVTSLVPETGNTTKHSGADTMKVHIHVTGGWEIHVVDSLSGKDAVYHGGDTIPFVGQISKDVFVVSPDSDTVIVDFFVRPDTMSLFRSSSSVNSGSSSSEKWNYSHSDDENDDDIYQIYFSSSSDVGGSSSSDDIWNISSSSSCGGDGCLSNSSSSSGSFSNHSSSSRTSSSSSGVLSDVVPVDVRAIADAKFHTSGNMRISNQVTVIGTLFAGTGVEIGVETSVNSEIVSGNDIMLANRANVGDLRLTGNLYALDSAIYGSVTHVSNVINPMMPTFSFATGSSDIVIESLLNENVSPGTYRNFFVREGSKVHFAAGDYYFDSFWIDPYVELVFEQGSRIWIANGFNIANFCRVTHSGGMGDLFIYVGSSNYISIGNNVQMKAALYAPRATVQIFDHTVFEGFAWSANFNVEPFSTLK